MSTIPSHLMMQNLGGAEERASQVTGVVLQILVNGIVTAYPTDPAEIRGGMGTEDQISYVVGLNLPDQRTVVMQGVKPSHARWMPPMRIIPQRPGTSVVGNIVGDVVSLNFTELPAHKGCAAVTPGTPPPATSPGVPIIQPGVPVEGDGA